MKRKEFIIMHRGTINLALKNFYDITPDGLSRPDEGTMADAFCNACMRGCLPTGDEADIKAALCFAVTGKRDFNDPKVRAAADAFFGMLQDDYHGLEDVAIPEGLK